MIRINYDVLGIGVSMACAIHCAVFPLLLSGLPILGTGMLSHFLLELLMITLAAIIGFFALWHGYKKYHHRLLPAGIFVTGILFLLVKHWIPGGEIFLLIPAIIMIVSAHLLNFKLCRLASHTHRENCDGH